MCFSATASFSAASFLAIISIYSIHKIAHSEERTFLPIAMVPLFFAIQQFIEGLVWVLLQHESDPAWIQLASFGYIFFAYAFWPIWIPLSLTIYDRSRRIFFLFFTLSGIVYSTLLYVYLLLNADLVQTKILNHSLCYIQGCNYQVSVGGIVYLILTAGALLLASSKHLKILGLLTLISAIFAFIWYQRTFASVWCFFSAILSLYIAFVCYTIYHQET